MEDPMSSERHHNFLTRLGELGRTPLGVMLALGLAVAIAGAVVVPFLRNGGGPGSEQPVFADVDPVGCDTGIGSGSAFISAAVPHVPPLTTGDVIQYTVGVGYPAPPVGVGCT